MFTNTTPVQSWFLLNDVTERTVDLKPACDWCFSAKEAESTLLLCVLR